MTEKNHLNRPIPKLKKNHNTPDKSVVNSSDVSDTAKYSKDDTKTAGNSLKQQIKPTVKDNESTKDTKKIIPQPTKQIKLLLTKEEYQDLQQLI